MNAKHARTVVISVSSVAERDQVMKTLYTNMTKEPSVNLLPIKEQVNKICLYHVVKHNIRALIRTYLIVVIPINVNLSFLESVGGHLEYNLARSIKQLETITARLKSLHGRRVVKGMNDAKALEQLVRSLS